MKRISLLLFFLILTHSDLLARPNYRGFQLGIEHLTPDEIEELRSEWNVNLVRIQVGKERIGDGVSGKLYEVLMEESLEEIDALLPLFAAQNIGVILTLYSMPGGFSTREAPAHYQMFTQPHLQSEFVETWRVIAERYKDSRVVVGYDLANEPALRADLKSTSAQTWPALAIETVRAIRQIDPETEIIIKSLYGDPSRLRALPRFFDDSICYSFHAYPEPRYIGFGIQDDAVRNKPPSLVRIRRRTIRPVLSFLKKFPPRYRKRVCLNVGEFAVSRFAPSSDRYLRRLLRLFERSRIFHGRKGRYQRFNLKSYLYHAFDEATYWDPRLGSDGSLELRKDTKRALVLKKFFKRNTKFH